MTKRGFAHADCPKGNGSNCKCYSNGYQSGRKNGYYDGWRKALDAIQNPFRGRRIFYCTKCGKALNHDNRGGIHAECNK